MVDLVHANILRFPSAQITEYYDKSTVICDFGILAYCLQAMSLKWKFKGFGPLVNYNQIPSQKTLLAFCLHKV